MVHVMYNSTANNGHAYEDVKNIMEKVNDEVTLTDTSVLKDYLEYFENLNAGDRVILAGGDGTIHYLVNHIPEEQLLKLKLDYVPAGTGNDFANELGIKRGEILEDFTQYLVGLPTAKIKGEEYKILNGVGYGLDGYACEEGDRLRKITKKPLSYTSIALKGLLFKFKPVTAAVTVDGNTKVYTNVWCTPVMNGKCYGGGVFATPNQERLGEDRKISVMIFHCKSKLRSLFMFPSSYKGEHVKYRKYVTIMKGKNISVSFNRPCACQVDGDTITDVSKIEVSLNK